MLQFILHQNGFLILFLTEEQHAEKSACFYLKTRSLLWHRMKKNNQTRLTGLRVYEYQTTRD